MRVVFLVAGWVSDFKVLHGQAGHIIHRDLKVHRDRADLLAALGSCRLRQSYFCDECVLHTTLELLDGPLGDLLLWLVLETLPLYALW